MSHKAYWPVIGALGFVLLTAYRFQMSTGTVRNSDDTGNFLAGVEMAEGNWRLSGWFMAVDNYYPTDVLGQAVLRRLFGWHPIFMPLWEAVVWTAIAMAGCWLACRAKPGRTWFGIGLLAFALLAFNVFDHRFEDYFLFGVASHGCTILLTLLVFALACSERSRPAMLGLIVVIGCFSDPIFNTIACLPILAASVLRLGEGGRRHGARIVATLLGAAAARLLVAAMSRSGGFQSVPMSITLASFAELQQHIGFSVESILRLLGANVFGRDLDHSIAASPVIQFLRLPLAVLFAVALCQTMASLWRQAQLWPSHVACDSAAGLDNLLGLRTFCCIASACLTTVIYEDSGARFFLPAAVTGSVLAARKFGQVRLAALYGGIVLPASAAMGIAALPRNQTPAATMFLPQFRRIVEVLRQHDLSHGYAGYWEGTMLTVMSHRQITSLPLLPDAGGHLHAFRTLTNHQWYADAARDWRGRVFFISARPPAGAELSDEAGRQQFGSPHERYDLGQFVIEVFDASAPGYRAPTD